MPIIGQPMLARQIERAKRSKRLGGIVLATSTEHADQAVADIAKLTGVEAYRGSLDDVLDRYYQAARPHNPEWVVRLTGDCPLIDPDVIDNVIDQVVTGGYDYGSNALEPTWPDGLDIECFRFSVLERNWREATTTVEREHVTPYIYNNRDKFRVLSAKGDRDLSGLRWTVDEPRDFEFVTRVYDALYPANPAFTTEDVLNFLARNPDVLAINADIERNEGYRLSLEKLAADRAKHEGKAG